MSRKPIHVSDHALLRYVERVLGFDLDRARADIAAIVGPAIRAGAVKIAIGGHTYILKGDVVTTIIPGATPTGARMKLARHRGQAIRVKRDRV